MTVLRNKTKKLTSISLNLRLKIPLNPCCKNKIDRFKLGAKESVNDICKKISLKRTPRNTLFKLKIYNAHEATHIKFKRHAIKAAKDSKAGSATTRTTFKRICSRCPSR